MKEKDPQYFKKVDYQNPHRLIRALEIIRTSGKPYSSFLNQKKKIAFSILCIIGLTAERETVYKRINERVDKMMKEGLLKEVERTSSASTFKRAANSGLPRVI